ncbi:uncharacterized protein LOC142235670 [Haematobia irritans]|uniref:uncharacterized protein LOC142235659 n=1 Tax=Haematobia irritans TaxID=7368 RepID=UPI003F4FE958
MQQRSNSHTSQHNRFPEEVHPVALVQGTRCYIPAARPTMTTRTPQNLTEWSHKSAHITTYIPRSPTPFRIIYHIIIFVTISNHIIKTLFRTIYVTLISNLINLNTYKL